MGIATYKIHILYSLLELEPQDTGRPYNDSPKKVRTYCYYVLRFKMPYLTDINKKKNVVNFLLLIYDFDLENVEQFLKMSLTRYIYD